MNPRAYLLRRLLGPQGQPGRVVDFGAYCGGSTLAFARDVGPGGHVVAFEPDPANAAALRENVARHADGAVTVREAGVWSESAELEFAAEGNMGAAIASVLARPAATVCVPVLSLADAMSRACQVSGSPAWPSSRWTSKARSSSEPISCASTGPGW
jgi:FkbM family methyltransferase